MATIKNLEFARGSNAVMEIAVSNASGAPVNLTTYTANVEIKKHPESANAVYMGTTLYANGVMVLNLDAANTAAMDIGRYVYRVYITHDTSNNTIAVQRGLMVFTSYP